MFSYPGYLDIRERATSFEQVAAFATALVGVSESGEATSRRVFTFAVSDGYFETFGDVLAAGRDFTAGETAPRANRPVAVVSHGFWSRHGFDPDLLGQTVNVNGTTFTIVGITRQGFTGTSLVGPELWVPLGVYGSSVLNFLPDAPEPDFSARDGETLFLVGRLRSGTSTDAANAELETLATQLAQAHPDPGGGQTLSVAAPSKLGISTRPQTDREPRLLALLLSLLAGVVLLVACLNLANLLLARGSARRTEIAIRRSLGGGRARIVPPAAHRGTAGSRWRGASSVSSWRSGRSTSSWRRSRRSSRSASPSTPPDSTGGCWPRPWAFRSWPRSPSDSGRPGRSRVASRRTTSPGPRRRSDGQVGLPGRAASLP